MTLRAGPQRTQECETAQRLGMGLASDLLLFSIWFEVEADTLGLGCFAGLGISWVGIFETEAQCTLPLFHI